MRDTRMGAEISALAGSHVPVLDLGPHDAHGAVALAKRFYPSAVIGTSQIQARLVVDGDASGRPDLVAIPFNRLCPWLERLVVLACLSADSADATARSSALANASTLRLASAETLGWEINGQRCANEVFAAVLRPPGEASILILSGSTPPSWPVLAKASATLAEALGLPSLDRPLRDLFWEFSAFGGSLDSTVNDAFTDGLARAVRIDPAAARRAFDSLVAVPEAAVPWIRAAILHRHGAERLQAFDASLSVIGRAVAPELIVSLPDGRQLLEAAHGSTGAVEFRRNLQIGHAAFNKALLALQLPPIKEEAFHARAMAQHVKGPARADYDDALRYGFRPLFEMGGDLSRYVALRDALDRPTPDSPNPDPAWLLDFEEPTETMLRGRVQEWLRGQGLVGSRSTPRLKPLGTVRDANASLIARTAARAKEVIAAWCAKMPGRVAPGWLSSEDVAGALRDRLDRAGVLDFIILDQSGLIARMRSLSLWPTDMDGEIDPDKLGLSRKDLERGRGALDQAREDRKREARIISLRGQDVDPEDDTLDRRMLAVDFAKLFPKNLDRLSVSNLARLNAVRPRPSQEQAREGGRGRAGQLPSTLPEASRQLIGLLGEVMARRWLAKQFKGQNVDLAWRSENRSLLNADGDPGSDSLGYDFRFTWWRKPWFIEVKASLGDSRAFTLGSSEVRKALDCVAGEGRYSVLYLSNVGDPERLGIDVLPNPLAGDAPARGLSLTRREFSFSFTRAP